ncbi:hypothetical protein EVAR_86901_1 [Eumeta japonica]|uniref:Uncharacterized protein n=1 Tax=Eumeta variegata TaxID=151549 RepID=A0A4C1W820_EUMVA|nr:hypothetical protein EVAR_86901_1 [Eumeta japonica]
MSVSGTESCGSAAAAAVLFRRRFSVVHNAAQAATTLLSVRRRLGQSFPILALHYSPSWTFELAPTARLPIADATLFIGWTPTGVDPRDSHRGVPPDRSLGLGPPTPDSDGRPISSLRLARLAKSPTACIAVKLPRRSLCPARNFVHRLHLHQQLWRTYCERSRCTRLRPSS